MPILEKKLAKLQKFYDIYNTTKADTGVQTTIKEFEDKEIMADMEAGSSIHSISSDDLLSTGR